MRVCVHGKYSESWKSRIDVYSQWNMEFNVDQDQYNWNGHKGQ